MFHVIEEYRLTSGAYASDEGYGNNGAFAIDRGRTKFVIVASDGMDWEHVSVHCVSEGKDRTPTWSEMCFVKDLFWDEEDCVVQYHPAKMDYVDRHKHTLHLWRPMHEKLPTPHICMV